MSNIKRKLVKKFKNPKFLIKFILISLIVLAFLILFVFNNIRFLGLKSVNQGANKYETRSCLAFYPNNANGKTVAKSLCKDAPKNSIFDYALVPYGDYYLVSYGTEEDYYINKETGEALKIDYVDENIKTLLSDYLRYEMKKDELDEAYTLEFIEDSMPDNMHVSDYQYSIKGADLAIQVLEFGYEVTIPLKYAQKYLNIDLGYDESDYIRPVYVSPRRKIVAFTFDDGPKYETSSAIINCLHKYDAVGTFFVQGMYLDSKTMPLIKESISYGNQYGSHTQDHKNLKTLDSEEIYAEIIGPANDFINGFHGGTSYDFDGIDYTMSIYRAPYGSHDSSVDSAAPFIAISWDYDSLDWSYRDSDKIVGEVLNYESTNSLNGKIILFHDTYSETYEAMEILIPKLIAKGYQFVSVDEILEYNGISHNEDFYPW